MENNSVIICFIRLNRVLIQAFETSSFFFNLKCRIRNGALQVRNNLFYEMFYFSSCFDNERSL